MIIWAVAGGGVILLLVTILFSSIKCKVIVHKSGKYERIVLLFQACYGMLRWKYEWRAIRFIDMNTGFQMHIKSENHVGMGHGLHRKTSEAQIDRKRIKKYMNNAQRFLHHAQGVVVWMKETFGLIHCNRFTWDTEIGLRDPAAACLLSGFSWSVKSTFIGVITDYMQFEVAPKMEVVPQFNTLFFSTRVVCITQIRIVHAISAVLKLMIRIICVKGGIRTWRNILSGA